MKQEKKGLGMVSAYVERFNSYNYKIWREKNIKLNISFNIIKIVTIDLKFGNKLIL